MNDPFRGRAKWLIAVAAISLGLTIGFGLFSDDPSSIITPEANAFSHSAIGHHALVRFLDRIGLPVQISRYQTEGKLAPGVAFLLLSPPVQGTGLDEAAALVVEALTAEVPTIIVLPKWRVVSAEPVKPGWVEELAWLTEEEVETTLATLLDYGEGAGPRVVRGYSSRFRENLGDLALTPELPNPQFLEGGPDFTTVVETNGRTLVAQLRGQALWVIADPDLLNNAGLALGENAAIVHRLLVREIGAHAVLIDETQHGFLQPPSIWRELTSFPLALVTLQMAVLLGAVVWTAGFRFGRPKPVPPRVAPGIGTLIDNTARLVRLAGDPGDTLQRYFQLTVRHAARQCALPPNLELKEQIERLAHLGRSRGVPQDLEQLARRVEQFRPAPGAHRSTLEICRDLAAWRKEITDGFR